MVSAQPRSTSSALALAMSAASSPHGLHIPTHSARHKGKSKLFVFAIFVITRLRNENGKEGTNDVMLRSPDYAE
ncbi:uncharacterized protein G2W53_020031 [Senna tora]|uniref:Uncharacterized protein n=1 Tax=Senna tora TaxID=362788 RepID=A0A834TX65_9FABA|nr:uncharacterized protein G2W53_020031 [Senna tora]